jgi:DNA-binding MarR family transcriptional regulator
MKEKKVSKYLNIKQKLSAIQEVEKGSLLKDIAKKYGITPSSLSGIMKNKIA